MSSVIRMGLYFDTSDQRVAQYRSAVVPRVGEYICLGDAGYNYVVRRVEHLATSGKCSEIRLIVEYG